MSDANRPASPVLAALRDHALTLPEAWEDFPWGDRVVKVGKKIFVFLGAGGDGADDVAIGVKLPRSGEAALSMPFVEPTGYGLGKSGWVSGRFAPRDLPPVATLRAWIDESYRAVAPAKLVKQLDGGPAEAPPPAPKKKPVAKKKPAVRRTSR